MKWNRIALVISVLLILSVFAVGCTKKTGTDEKQSASSSADNNGMVSSTKYMFMEQNGGEKSADISDKELLKEVRKILNSTKPVEKATAPEDEEPSIYVEWDGGDNSYFAFVYLLGDGTSLIEVSSPGAEDDTTKYYTGATTYNDLEMVIDHASQAAPSSVATSSGATAPSTAS